MDFMYWIKVCIFVYLTLAKIFNRHKLTMKESKNMKQRFANILFTFSNNSKSMIKPMLILTCLIIVFGCNNPKTGNSTDSTGLDSISVIYTKDKWSIVRPKWNQYRHFAVTCKMMNTATVFSYKDFVIEVNYKSKTGTTIETRKYTLYTSIHPQKYIELDEYIEDPAPEGTSFHETKWKILSATEYIMNK
jgi:hypothetical protein